MENGQQNADGTISVETPDGTKPRLEVFVGADHAGTAGGSIAYWEGSQAVDGSTFVLIDLKMPEYPDRDVGSIEMTAAWLDVLQIQIAEDTAGILLDLYMASNGSPISDALEAQPVIVSPVGSAALAVRVGARLPMTGNSLQVCIKSSVPATITRISLAGGF